ncbi:MAG: hypothetical protein DMF12_11805 [Verrucomicrobia bacterium]|nr:MAG: hypothetical protein DMF12_11805 [Verrucomicrobiota bacterium]
MSLSRSYFFFSPFFDEPTGCALFAFFPCVIRMPVVGCAPLALLPRVVRAPVLGRAYSVTPTFFHAGLYKILRKPKDESPKYFARRANHFQDAKGKKNLSWLESAVLRTENGAWRIHFFHSTRVPSE